jgi:hypothetical protein
LEDEDWERSNQGAFSPPEAFASGYVSLVTYLITILHYFGYYPLFHAHVGTHFLCVYFFPSLRQWARTVAAEATPSLARGLSWYSTNTKKIERWTEVVFVRVLNCLLARRNPHTHKKRKKKEKDRKEFLSCV